MRNYTAHDIKDIKAPFVKLTFTVTSEFVKGNLKENIFFPLVSHK